jgi:alkylhydroperoxidase family enzyme
MARLTQPPRGAFDGDDEDLAAYDTVIEREVGLFSQYRHDDALGAPNVGEYWGALLNSPRMTAIAGQMGNFVRTAGERPDSYKHWERELVDQVLSADWKTNVVQGLHVPDAVSAGVRLEAIEALRYGHEEDLNDDERLLVRYIRAVVSGDVDDDLFATMKARMGPRGLVDYTAFIMWLSWIMRMMQALGTPAVSDAELDAVIAGLKDGSVPVPDFRERLG